MMVVVHSPHWTMTASVMALSMIQRGEKSLNLVWIVCWEAHREIISITQKSWMIWDWWKEVKYPYQSCNCHVSYKDKQFMVSIIKNNQDLGSSQLIVCYLTHVCLLCEIMGFDFLLVISYYNLPIPSVVVLYYQIRWQ